MLESSHAVHSSKNSLGLSLSLFVCLSFGDCGWRLVLSHAWGAGPWLQASLMPGVTVFRESTWSLVHVHVVLCTGRCWQLLLGDFTCCESWARLLLPPLLTKCSFKIQCIIFQNIIWIRNSVCALLSPVGDVNMLKDGCFCHCDSTTINVWAGTAPPLTTAAHSTWRVKPL